MSIFPPKVTLLISIGKLIIEHLAQTRDTKADLTNKVDRKLELALPKNRKVLSRVISALRDGEHK